MQISISLHTRQSVRLEVTKEAGRGANANALSRDESGGAIECTTVLRCVCGACCRAASAMCQSRCWHDVEVHGKNADRCVSPTPLHDAWRDGDHASCDRSTHKRGTKWDIASPIERSPWLLANAVFLADADAERANDGVDAHEVNEYGAADMGPTVSWARPRVQTFATF